MREVLVFPDAEYVALTWLDENLDVPVHTLVPDPRPSAWVRVQRTGGIRSTIVTDAASITVEAWADTYEIASDLAQLARGYLHAATGENVDGVAVWRVEEFAGPASLPDPISGQPRHTFTVAMHLRGVVIDTTS